MNEVKEHFGRLILIRLANGRVALLVMENKKKKQEDANSTGSLGHRWFSFQKQFAHWL